MTTDQEKRFSEAKELHQKGIDGDKEAVRAAYALIAQLREELPDDPVITAYYGSLISLLGRDALEPNERFEKAIKGLKILDGAVASAPDNTEIRILRGYVSARLPETFFHRTKTAVEDFSYLISRYESDNTIFSSDFYCQLLYDLGAAYQTLERQTEMEATWRKLLSITQDGKYVNLVRQAGMGEITATQGATESEPAPEIQAERARVRAQILTEGRKLHQLALSGDKQALEKALGLFSQGLELTGHDPLIKAYYADCLSLSGRDAAEPTAMFANAIKAFKMLDSAVNGEPDNIQIRLLRAKQSLRLPEAFFHRTATAVTDLEYLRQRYEEDATVFPEKTYWQVLYALGEAYLRLGMEEEAEATWGRLLALEPDPEAGYQERLAAKQRQREQVTVSPLAYLNRKVCAKEAKRLHDLGVAGNRQAALKALELWQKLAETDPQDATAQGYYGSALALTARDANDPSQLFGNTIKGLVILNKAIGRDWQNWELRLLRAYLTYSLPENFFHMTEKAIKDFRFLKTTYERDNTVFDREIYWEVLYHLGKAYARLGRQEQAEKTWARLRKQNAAKYRALVEKEQGPSGIAQISTE